MDGRELDWGEILVWEPPERLVYSWHLKRSREDATESRSASSQSPTTRPGSRIEHRGWERLGAEGPSWRDSNHGGWTTLLPHYLAALAAERGG